VVPTTDGATQSTGSEITFVTAFPTGGNPGDMAVGEDGSSVAWNVYYNVAGTWVLQGNIQATANQLLHSDFSDSLNSAITTLETLKTYTLAANTLSTDMGYIEVEALFYVASGISADLYLTFGSETLATYTSSVTETGYVRLKGRIVKGVVNQYLESSVVVIGNPNAEIEYNLQTISEDLTSSVVIAVKSQKSTAGSIGDIVTKDLNIKISQ
jgi:hypothetical protein